MRQARPVALMGDRGMRTGFLWDSQKERDHWEELDMYGRIILE
jgi:hypothetical protein